MSRQQATFIVLLNALLSALISGAVVLAAFALYSPPVIERTVSDGRPAAAASPTRRTAAITYVVKPGDTLSGIAAAFDISAAALMQANGLTNPNVLAAGQVLTIPPADLTPAPALFGTPAAQGTSPAPILKIAAIARAVSQQAPAGETVIIQNVGPRVNLKGWTLADLHGNLFVFPDIVLESGASVRVHTESGLDTATDLYWGRTAAVWSANDTATLKDRDGGVIDIYTVRR